MNRSRRLVATVSGFPVQFNKAIVGKNAFAHESGIHQDGMLKNAETFEIMRPEDVGPQRDQPRHGQAFRAARRCAPSSRSSAIELGDNQLNDVFVRFKELADRKKEVYDDDLDRADAGPEHQRRERPHPGRSTCGWSAAPRGRRRPSSC